MSNQGQGLLSHVYLGFVSYYKSLRYQVSVYRTISPLVCCFFCVCFIFLRFILLLFFLCCFFGLGFRWGGQGELGLPIKS